MSRLTITLETPNRQLHTARHSFTQTLEIVRRALLDGINSGVLENTPNNSAMRGAWLLEMGEEAES